MNSQTDQSITVLPPCIASAPLTVACLCAAWCGVCQQYGPAFNALQSKYPSVNFLWVDVEDEEALVGELDIETFPTLLIGRGEVPLFLGPLLPQIQVLERLLVSFQGADQPTRAVSAEALGLWRRLMSN